MSVVTVGLRMWGVRLGIPVCSPSSATSSQAVLMKGTVITEQPTPQPGRVVERTEPGGLLVTTTATLHEGTTIDLHWSLLAGPPAIWMRFESGETIDPREPEGLSVLPLTNAVLLGVEDARGLKAALDVWIERLDAAARDEQ